MRYFIFGFLVFIFLILNCISKNHNTTNLKITERGNCKSGFGLYVFTYGRS